MFACQECGRKFRTVKAAQNASYDGCPGCGGCDIDLASVSEPIPFRIADPGVVAAKRDFDKSRRVED